LKIQLSSIDVPDSSKVEISYDLGRYYTDRGSLDSALKYAEQSLSLSRSLEDSRKLSRALQLTGSIQQKMGKNEESLRNLLEAMRIANQDNDVRRQATVFNELGNLYLGYNDWILALESYEEAYDRMERLNLKPYQAIIRANIGLIYIDMGDYETAIQMMKEAFVIDPSINPATAANTYLNIGNAYSQLSELDMAFYYLYKSDSIINKLEIDHQRPFVLYNIGYTMLKKGDTVLAKSNIRQSLEWSKQLSTNRILADAAYDLSRILAKENKYDSSLHIAKEAFDIIEGSGNYRQIAKMSRQLADLCEILNYPMEELKYVKMLRAANDSIDMADTRTKILLERFRQIRAEEREEFDRQFRIMQRDKSLIIYCSVAILLTFVLVFYSRYQKIQNLKTELLEEIDFLKNKFLPLETVGTEDNSAKVIVKEKIEEHINKKLNHTDWNILNTLYETPLISNKDLASKVYLSLEGTSSSLRKMYVLFGIESKTNKKMELLRQAILISSK